MNNSILTAKNIIDMRNEMGLTRDALAKMLGISSKTVARWENQNSSEPPTGTAAIVLSNLISNTLNIPMEEGKSDLILEMENIHEKTRIKENPDTIFLLLNQADADEKSEICKALKLPVDADVFQISKEYRSAAGHTIGNWFRGDHDMPYKAILVDVASKLKPKNEKSIFHLSDGRSEEEVENNIVHFFAKKVADELNKMGPEERSKRLETFLEKINRGENVDLGAESLEEIKKGLAGTTVTTAGVATLLTGKLTAALFYSGTFAGLWASVFGMSTSLLLLTGTGVGTLVAAPLLLLILGSPSYKKTIPVTLQLINIRRRITQNLLE